MYSIKTDAITINIKQVDKAVDTLTENHEDELGKWRVSKTEY